MRYGIHSGYCAPGYITEKIFGAFAAGCVPSIYYGAPNIETYIPKDCFINYLDFQTPEELYNFMVNMPEDVYEPVIRKTSGNICKATLQSNFHKLPLKQRSGKRRLVSEIYYYQPVIQKTEGCVVHACLLKLFEQRF